MEPDHRHPSPPESAKADNEDGNGGPSPSPLLCSSFPLARVKKIVKLDRDINKLTSEALLLISLSTDLFLGFLAERSGAVALSHGKRTVRIEHLRSAVRAHAPTRDFLLDCLPEPLEAPKASTRKEDPEEAPPGARRIDEFFRKLPEVDGA